MNAFSPLETIEQVQLEKLKEMLAYLQMNSPYYQSVFTQQNIYPEKIISFADLALLPTTSKEEMQERNWDFLCVSREKIVEYTATSGTMGKPVTIALTEGDLQRLAHNEWLSLESMGATPHDIFQLMLTLDRQFMAGMAYYSGIRKLGAGMVRVGPGAPAQQWDTIFRLQPSIIVAVPSFMVKLVEYALSHGIDLKHGPVRKALCIGENIRNPDFSLNVLGRRITDNWPIELYGTYASTEMQTAFTECQHGLGGHLNPGLLIVELLNEENKPVGAGQKGEVTITTLGVEGMPLLRYKTGDICTYHPEPCACGRNSLRLSAIIGRKKQMIKLKGTTLYPPALFDLLNDIPEIVDYVVELTENELGLDEVSLHISPTELSERVDRSIKTRLQANLRIIPDIKYQPPEAIHRLQFPDGNRKPIRFIDHRK